LLAPWSPALLSGFTNLLYNPTSAILARQAT